MKYVAMELCALIIQLCAAGFRSINELLLLGLSAYVFTSCEAFCAYELSELG